MQLSETIDPQVATRFQFIKKMGSGAYGVVWHVKDSSQREWALKKICDAFRDETDAKRTYRQLALLRQLNHSNVIKLHEIIPSGNMVDVYLVMDFMRADLNYTIQEATLSPQHHRYIFYQTLLGVFYLHSAGLVHRDLKPANLLINFACNVKICDFGLARTVNPNTETPMTEEVATRWYRAPQILLGSSEYGFPVDLWSVGCIMAEAVLKQPLFPGDSTNKQLQYIIDVLGTPSRSDLDDMAINTAYFQRMQMSFGKKTPKFKDLFWSHDKDLVDLIASLLRFNPQDRCTAEKALKHRYFESLWNSHPIVRSPTKLITDVNQSAHLTLHDYRTLVEAFAVKKQQIETKPAPSFSKIIAEKVSQKEGPLNGSDCYHARKQSFSEPKNNTRPTFEAIIRKNSMEHAKNRRQTTNKENEVPNVLPSARLFQQQQKYNQISKPHFPSHNQNKVFPSFVTRGQQRNLGESMILTVARKPTTEIGSKVATNQYKSNLHKKRIK